MSSRLPDDVATLVERARAGDAAAADRLVRLHLGAAYAVALAVTQDPRDAEDVVQDALVSALEHLGDCRPAGFSGWLMQIVRNRARNHRRYLRVRTAAPLEVAVSAASGDNPARDAEREELKERLLAALGTLNDVQRQVVLLHDLEGWKHREIAVVLEMPEGTVRHHLFHARRALRAQLSVLTRDDA